MAQRNSWQSLRATVWGWRFWALPGMAMVGLVVAARLVGSLQGLELFALDSLMRLRPAEPRDDRIVLVGIDAADIQKIGYPVPEAAIVDLLKTVQTYKPTVIGLNILWNNSVKSNNQNLFVTLGRTQNAIAVEKLLPTPDQILPPIGFPPEQVGFSDIVSDVDGRLRRILLGTSNPINARDYKLSLIIRLTEAYLRSRDQKLGLQNGIRDKFAMRFGTTELPRLSSNSGGYVGVDAGGPQLLMNFRRGLHPFRRITLRQLKTGQVQPEWLRDRIVIVGITDPQFRPPLSIRAIPSSNNIPGTIDGIEMQAHSVSQIISAVLDHRPLLQTWADGWEYGWIVLWGAIGIALGQRTQFLRRNLLVVGCVNLGLFTGSYLMLAIGNVWIPLIPVLFVLNLNVLFPAIYDYVYEQERALKSRLQERQRTIEQTFNIIHNGPLQTLATLLRRLRDDNLPQPQLLSILENLNREIRNIGEHLRQESLAQEDSLYLRTGLKLDLQSPLHELFYEVYSSTLERPEFSSLGSLKVAWFFEPIEQPTLTSDQKRNLCRFLEEAIGNIAKHAEGATHLNITGTHQRGWYMLQIKDNGMGLHTTHEGEGSKQARRLAAQLKGHFKRSAAAPQGTLCELSWPLTQSWFQKLGIHINFHPRSLVKK
ncbi:MAG: CHASE2 domain-containing protein [Scytolyngbya sp. HA4215-MV1]|jgi:CHASE2 domain-containing sensor protein|nr:CHASE2 domain-containing protein [Scytolyngbya sp. HA4215-MV1]